MCDRFTLRTPLTVLAKQFEFVLDAAFTDAQARYNIAPTPALVIVARCPCIPMNDIDTAPVSASRL